MTKNPGFGFMARLTQLVHDTPNYMTYDEIEDLLTKILRLVDEWESELKKRSKINAENKIDR